MCHKCGSGILLGVKTKKFTGKDGVRYTLPSNILLRCSNCHVYSVDVEARDSLLETTKIGLKDLYRTAGMDDLAINLRILTTLESYQTFLGEMDGSYRDIL
jgi:hypothetical protein